MEGSRKSSCSSRTFKSRKNWYHRSSSYWPAKKDFREYDCILYNNPHFSYFEEVDITHLDELRVHLNSNRTDGQPKLTYLPFIMQALVKALGENPVCNALFDDEKGVVTRHDAVHLGIATQTDRGLYVPVVKHVEAQDIWQSASRCRESAKLLETELRLAELTGSTFTITSLGRMGGLGATPIINKPEVGIQESTTQSILQLFATVKSLFERC